METPGMSMPSTIRRNPPRKAKMSSCEKSAPQSSVSSLKLNCKEGRALLSSFAAAAQPNDSKIEEQNVIIPPCKPEMPTDLPLIEQVELKSDALNTPTVDTTDKLRVFLRIRPARVARSVIKRLKKTTDNREAPKLAATKSSHSRRGHAAETNSSAIELPTMPDLCLRIQGPTCVTLVAPASCPGLRKSKAEEFDGFSRVFAPESSQEEVFGAIIVPRLVDLLRGESSLVVALGPTSAGKTHTMLGNPSNPGLLPRSLRFLLEPPSPNGGSTSRKIDISMFEIYSEQGGRSEKILDLLQGGIEVTLQQSKLKGLNRVTASTVQEADAIVFNGLHRRTTATTAANDKSSRSHCIINISVSQVAYSIEEEALVNSKPATLTIADLAGFERERKTGNQGIRLNESNFINNTSMVFGQCLRALLEHQKNPKKALQKHFQYSMLTRYLKPYLEAKGNMTLVVNVSPCNEDYLDTALVLRQAAPYSNIKLSLGPSEEAFDNLRMKRKGSLSKERDLSRKRRKVDVLKNTGCDKQGSVQSNSATGTRGNCENISCGVDADKINTQNSFAEQNICGEGQIEGPINGHTFQNYGKRNMGSLDSYMGDELKKRVLSEVDEVLRTDRMDNYDCISVAVSEQLNEVLEQHCKNFEALKCQLRHQQKELVCLTTSLLKEQEQSLALSSELKSLKEYSRELEKQNAKLESACSFRRLGVSSVQDTEDVSEILQVEGGTSVTMNKKRMEREDCYCGQELMPQNVCEDIYQPNIHKDSFQGQEHGEGWPDSGHSMHLELSPGCRLQKLNDVQAIEVECNNNHCSVLALELLDRNEQSEKVSQNLILERSVVSADHDNAKSAEDLDELKTDQVDELNEYAPGKSKFFDQDVQADSRPVVMMGAQLMSDNPEFDDGNVLMSTICMALEKGEPELDLKKGEHVHGSVCNQSPSQMECRQQPKSPVKDEYAMQSQKSPLPLETDDCKYSADLKAQVHNMRMERLQKEQIDCAVSQNFSHNYCKMSFKDYGVSEKNSARELLMVPTAQNVPCLQQSMQVLNLSAVPISGDSRVQETRSCDLGLQRGNRSHLQKGRLLALSLTNNSNPSLEKESRQKAGLSGFLNSPETLGPIGLELEGLLGIHLVELENSLWIAEAAMPQKLVNLLADNGGVLDLNIFKKRYSPQRSICIRYCLAVICNKMRVDGEWLPLLRKNASSRRRSFYAVVQARTVGEAAGYARAGLQEEHLSKITLTPAMSHFQEARHSVDSSTAESQMINKSSIMNEEPCLKPRSMLKIVQDKGKDTIENVSSNGGKQMLVEPVKRRKLQPLSSLAFNADMNTGSTLEYMDTVESEAKDPFQEEVDTRSLRHGAAPLAYLLTHQRH